MTKTTVSFFPAHIEMNEEQHIAAITRYREWLDTYGDYGRLYMMNQDRKPLAKYEAKFETPITGIDIYDPELALMFRMIHNL